MATQPHPYLNIADLEQKSILEEWHSTVAKIIVTLARRSSEFTADDVWEKLPDDLRGMADPRSLGPIMKRAQKDKVIKPTKRYENSVRRRGAPIKVWKSLLYKA